MGEFRNRPLRSGPIGAGGAPVHRRLWRPFLEYGSVLVLCAVRSSGGGLPVRLDGQEGRVMSFRQTAWPSQSEE